MSDKRTAYRRRGKDCEGAEIGEVRDEVRDEVWEM